MIVLWNNDHYLDAVFFEKYGLALDIARELGMTLIFWDENGFPSGQAGGLLEARHSEHLAKRLDMASVEVSAARKKPVRCARPDGEFLGAVAVNRESGESLALACEQDGDELVCAVPKGEWTLCLFSLAVAGKSSLGLSEGRLVDYLSGEAVDALIETTYAAFYARFPEHFGTTIRYAFYDEPSFWHIEGGRIWTAGFDAAYRAKYGESPLPLYPALFFDLPGAESARHRLLSLRADLYADNYVGKLAAWCAAHGLLLTGHMDQEEMASPVPLSGDLIKVMRAQHIPGVDEIAFYNRASSAYKLISSAAVNYDKPAVMCEVYGAMGADMPVSVLCKQAMDGFAKGISFVVPHGTWYDAQNNVIFPPELSFRTPPYAEAMPRYNEYAARCSALLRGGRHVSDIALYYPIEDLEAGYRFEEGDPYLGGRIPPHTDYLALGERLSTELRRDFCYLHPDVLADCRVENGRLYLDHDVQFQRYAVVILPSMRAIRAESLAKLEVFVRSGGRLIAAGQLPSLAVEPGRDGDVQKIIARLFPEAPGNRTHGGTGCAIWLGGNAVSDWFAAFLDCKHVFDVSVPAVRVSGGQFHYIHRVLGGRDVYFFANSSDQAVDVCVTLRGEKTLESWNPHTGVREKARAAQEAGQTRLRVTLAPVQSRFYVGSPESEG